MDKHRGRQPSTAPWETTLGAQHPEGQPRGSPGLFRKQDTSAWQEPGHRRKVEREQEADGRKKGRGGCR